MPTPKTLQELATQKARSTSPSLCVANGFTIAISTPGGDEVLIPTPEKRRVTRLLSALSGIFVEVVPSSDTKQANHFHISRPFEEMVPFSFPDPGHRLVYASMDVPVIVSRTDSSVAIWAWKEIEKESSLGNKTAGGHEGHGEEEDPFAAFVRTAATSTSPRRDDLLLGGGEQLPPPRELHLTLLHEVSAHHNDHVEAFLAHDLRGYLVLCLCVASELLGLSFIVNDLNIEEMKPSFCIRDVASAGAVLAVRRHQRCLDILICHSSGALSLFMGRNRLCSLELDRPPEDYIGHQIDEGLIVTEAVSAQFSLVSTTGAAVRYSLNTPTFSSPLVHACLSAISFTFENGGMMLRMTTLYHDMLTMCSRKANVSTTSDQDHDWNVFERALLQSSAERCAQFERDCYEPMDTDTDLKSGARDYGDEDWLVLLGSEYHKRWSESRLLGPQPSTTGLSGSLKGDMSSIKGRDSEVSHRIMIALHVLYEEQKLCPLSECTIRRLAALNTRLAKAIGAFSFVDYYRRDNTWDLNDAYGTDLLLTTATDLRPVPALLEYLASMVRGERPPCEYPLMEPNVFPQSQCSELVASWRAQSPAEVSARVVRYFQCLYIPNDPGLTYDRRAEALLLAMVKDRFDRGDLEALPFGVALPLQDALMACRQNPASNWPYSALVLIGREDSFDFGNLENGSGEKANEAELAKEHLSLLQIQAAAASIRQTPGSVLPTDTGVRNISESDMPDDNSGDGCEMQSRLFQLRFSSDRRADEVRRILRSTDPVFMTQPVHQVNDNSVEFDVGTEQRRKLDFLVRKRFASPIGRGAYTLRTFTPTDPTKPLSVPKICTTGVLFAQKGSKIPYSPGDSVRLQWGEFHNGVAAGLRIAAAGEDKESESSQILTRSWILNHRPDDESASNHHAGMLLALGLGGYLPALRTTDYYEYLLPRHDLTSIGLMLGLAACNLGSMHEKITKMLCVHIRYFNGPGFAVPDFHVPVNVQTAAVLGLGLLHKGSCEHLIIDGLFAELCRRPRPGDNVDGREGLALAAGISIGLVCLGLGSSAFAAADKRRIDRLVQFGNNSPGHGMDKVFQSTTNVSGKAEGAGPEGSALTLADSESSSVKEGDFINSDVVSPGALLALALIYLKTNDCQIAKRIVIPDSLYTLDRCRPDHVFLRVLVRSLILWDDITASKAWIQKTLPALLRPVQNHGQPEVLDLLGRIELSGSYCEHDVDVPGVVHARAFAVAGACCAIALKYAGSNDEVAISLLLSICVAFEEALVKQTKDEESTSWAFLSCLGSTALSTSVVAAGSGNLEVFRVLRRLRKRRGRPQRNGRYGYHIASHAAIGFLFLGGGCQTFGRSDVGIVGLMCSLYPRFPDDIDDNQFHLQAMRHLYVLAVEPRYIETRDVETGTPCCVDLTLELSNGTRLKTQAPCIVPEAQFIREVSVASERYWSTTVHVNPAAPGRGWYSKTRGQVLFVKRRTGHLPYSVDPKGSKGILSRSICRPRPSAENMRSYFLQVDDLVRAFSADADVLAFVKYFCCPVPVGFPSRKIDVWFEANEKARRNVEMLYECLSKDKPEAIRIYMNSERALTAIQKGGADPSTVGSLLIASAYLDAVHCSRTPLLQPEYLSKLLLRVQDALDYDAVQQAVWKYVRSNGRYWPADIWDIQSHRKVLSDLGVVLRLQGIPHIDRLCDLTTLIKKNWVANPSKAELWPRLSLPLHGMVSEEVLETVISAFENNACDETCFT